MNQSWIKGKWIPEVFNRGEGREDTCEGDSGANHATRRGRELDEKRGPERARSRNL